MQPEIPLIICASVINLMWAMSLDPKTTNFEFVYPQEGKYFENSSCLTSDGQNGVCKNFSKCPQNQFKRTLEDICFFDQDIPYFCCRLDLGIDGAITNLVEKTINPESAAKAQKLVAATDDVSTNTTPQTTATTTQEPWILRTVDYACEKYRGNRGYRGGPLHPFLVGGIRVNFNEHPYMTAIGWTIAPEDIDWNCGGVVISMKFILTAAHCTNSSGIAPDIVRIGDIDLTSTNDTETPPLDFTIRNIFTHPDYKPDIFYHDIALIEINGEINDTIPACIWPLKQTSISLVTTGMGYGTRSFSGPKSNILYQGNLTLIRNDECSKRLLQNNGLPNGILPQQICAHDPERMVDTCQGDSGGPLINFYTNKRPFVIGITSFGSFCAGPLPGVYTRPTHYLDWIEGIVWPEFSSKLRITKNKTEG